MYDAVIIGGGTAGMTAGIYLAGRGKTAVVLERSSYGGQIINALNVENYPGIKSISGFDFATQMYEQLLAGGGSLEFGDVKEIRVNKNSKTVVTEDAEYGCERVIIASGASNRKLGIEGEEALVGRGISYCATCDGGFFKGKTVAVVGGGNTALDDGVYLADICERVYIIHRRDSFRGEQKTVDELRAKSNVEFVLNAVTDSLISGEDNKLRGVVVRDKVGGELRELRVDGLFVAVGQVPNTEFVKGLVDMDEYGYIKAGEDCRTSVDGIYAAGDCRTKELRQLCTAAADGAASAMY